MKLFTYISIKNRLFSVLAIWMVVLIGFGTFAIIEMQRLAIITQSIYENSLKASNAAIEIRVDVIKIQRDMKDIMLSESSVLTQYLIEQITELEKGISENLDIIRRNGSGNEVRQLEEEVRDILKKWRESRQEIMILLANSKKQEATEISQLRNSEYVQQLEERLDKLDKIERSSAGQLLERAQSIEYAQKAILIVSTTILGLLSGTLFLLIIRSILKPITALKKTMNDSANTGILSELNLVGKNEIVDIATCYNILVKNLRDQFWLKDGLNELNEQISGNLSIGEVAQRTICFLSRFTQSGRGVLYLYNARERCLKYSAAFALNREGNFSERYSLGEGIIGQVALERKEILLNNIKPGSTIIHTGTVSEEALNIYAFPLLHEDKLLGVIELASFEAFTELKQKFLLEGRSIIAISLHSAIKNQRIKQLLQVTEEAKQEAQVTASELKDANKILEEHQRLLQQQTAELQQTNAELEEQQLLLQQQSEELQQQSEDLQQSNIQLEEQQQQLAEQSRLLNIKNAELEKSREEIYNHSKKLEAANKYKSEFLANMSHELRTPLNSIILLSRLLKENKDRLSYDDAEKVNIIHSSGKELLRLINDILDLSKIEAGKTDLNIIEFHSRDLLLELRQMFESAAAEKKIQLIIEDEINDKIIGDRDKISQILRNFLSNSIKFTEEGAVTLRVAIDNIRHTGVVFSVSDTGIGIDEEQMALIFEEFQQGDGSISRRYGGTGLGLSISKKLAEIMKGEIKVESKLSAGSTFSLHLERLDNENHADTEKEIACDLQEDQEDGSGGSINIFSEGKKNILLIEGDEELASHIEKTNKGMGFKTIIASTGCEGLKIAAEYQLDGILLDIELPDISGIEVLRELKSTVELRNIPVHVFKGKRSTSNIHEDELVNSIYNMLSRRERQQGQILFVVEDDSYKEAMTTLFYSSGIRADFVDSEIRALKELKHKKYDLVIVDNTTESRQDKNLCKFVKAINNYLPIIIYTSEGLSFEEKRELKRYTDSIIIKSEKSAERLLDEVTLFLNDIKNNKNKEAYLSTKTSRDYALNLVNKKILIVDDDTRNIFVMASALEDYGAEVSEAENGEEALKKLRTEKIDLILMDVMMPVMNGYDAMRAIRKDRELKHTPIIALTAKSLKGDREKCIEAGANDYITKPVDYDVFIRIIKAWISK